MTKFCDTCPLKGNATGELIGSIDCEPVVRRKLGTVRRMGAFGVLVDDKGDISRILRVPQDGISQDLYDLMDGNIDMCQQPLTERRGLLRREVPSACPALGNIALSNDTTAEWDINRQLRPQFEAEAMGLVAELQSE